MRSDLEIRRSEMKDCDHDMATLVMELNLEWFKVGKDQIQAREKGNPKICDSVAKKSTLVFEKIVSKTGELSVAKYLKPYKSNQLAKYYCQNSNLHAYADLL